MIPPDAKESMDRNKIGLKGNSSYIYKNLIICQYVISVGVDTYLVINLSTTVAFQAVVDTFLLTAVKNKHGTYNKFRS